MTLEEKEKKTAKSLSIAQKEGSPTYWNYITGKLENTPNVNVSGQARKNIK